MKAGTIFPVPMIGYRIGPDSKPQIARKLIMDMLADREPPAHNKVVIVNRMLDKAGGDVEIVHLGRDGTTQGVCSIEADEDHVTSEHNDITCPLCFCIHEAICAKGDAESGYYEWDIDAIMATDAFLYDCMRSLQHCIAFKSGSDGT